MKGREFLAAAMTLAAAAVLADTQTVDGVVWNYDVKDGAAWVGRNRWHSETGEPLGLSACRAVSDRTCCDLVVPEELGGCPVEGVQSDAFSGCRGLTSVRLPSTVTWVGSHAFAYCPALTNVTLAAGLRQVGDGAFAGSLALRTVALPDNARPSRALRKGNPFVRFVPMDGVRRWRVEGDFVLDRSKQTVLAYLGTSSRVVVPAGVRHIGQYAFSGCGIDEVVLPESLETIGYGAFTGNEKLVSVVLPERIARIDDYAFRRCTFLTALFFRGKRCEVAGDAFDREGPFACFVTDDPSWRNGPGILPGFRGKKEMFENHVWDPSRDAAQMDVRVRDLLETWAKSGNDAMRMVALARLAGLARKGRLAGRGPSDCVGYLKTLLDVVGEWGAPHTGATWRSRRLLNFGGEWDAPHTWYWVQRELGRCHQEGFGVERDVRAAVRKYLLAMADGTDKVAAAALSGLIASGEGIARSDEAAFALASLACSGEDPGAETRLGRFYEEGVGVARDLKRARFCYERAFLRDRLTRDEALRCQADLDRVIRAQEQERGAKAD